MGIQGLLPLLRDITENIHMSELAGRTYAIDGYSWLHKGAWGCAEQLAKGEKTEKYVDYFMGRIRLLRYHGVEPFVVFDGGPLPAKKGTEEERSKSRAQSLAEAKALVAKGRASRARDYFVKALDITPEHALQVIKALKAEDVQYIVAPYEADAQMAYLENSGIVNGIITEDSDLLVFGCKEVLFKLNTDGYCQRVRRAMFTRCKEASFVGWGDKEFRWMAMLSGCDYLPSIDGIGLKTAYRLLRQWKTVDRVLQHIRREGKLKVPVKYQEEFEMAELAFVYQRVYCPLARRLVHLHERTEEVVWNQAKEAYVGGHLDDRVAQGIAMGEICPITLQPLKDINPLYKPGEIKKAKPLQDVTNRRASTGSIKPTTKTIDSFFGRVDKEKAPTTKKLAPELASRFKASGSGKRRLAEDGEELQRAKRARTEAARQPKVEVITTVVDLTVEALTVDTPEATPPDVLTQEPPATPIAAGLAETIKQTSSRFFGAPAAPTSPETIASDACEIGEPDEADVADVPPALPEIPQEDGYMSPLPPSSPAAISMASMSSPAFTQSTSSASPEKPRVQAKLEDDVDVSSPGSPQDESKNRPHLRLLEKLVPETPTQVKTHVIRSLALSSSEIDEEWPITPEEGAEIVVTRVTKTEKTKKTVKKCKPKTIESEIEEVLLEDEELVEKYKSITSSWWQRFDARSSSETTPDERRKSIIAPKPLQPSKPCRTGGRTRSFEPMRTKSGAKVEDKENVEVRSKEVVVEAALERGRASLLQFRRVSQ